jgi:gluconate kinase
MKDEVMQFLMHEAAHAFYAWEKDNYGDNSPLSDDDRTMWMRGYIHAQDMAKAKREVLRLITTKRQGDTT